MHYRNARTQALRIHQGCVVFISYKGDINNHLHWCLVLNQPDHGLCLRSDFRATRLLSRLLEDVSLFIHSSVLEMVGEFQVVLRVAPPHRYADRVKSSCERWLTCRMYHVPVLRLSSTALWFRLKWSRQRPQSFVAIGCHESVPHFKEDRA